ncbi:hypothetical protein K7432_007029 [Basidiobolus ranarum]|uniref:Uncharacterized protein n=1 Tax=Basidiobolus ranarum TaxID=34480 RepID=A0ABR2W168_9FUNG
MLAKICKDNDMKTFNCFLLRKGFIPSYMTIDTKILNYHILKNKNFTGNKVDIWGNVVNLKCKALKSQNAKTMKFEGTIETDGVGMSILKRNFSTARRGALSGHWKMMKASVSKALKSYYCNNEDMTPLELNAGVQYLEGLTEVKSVTNEK